MTFRYIGSKARLTGALSEAIRPFLEGGARFVDAFAGTGAVADAAATDGWPVWVNDALASAVVMATARLLSSLEAPFTALGGYEAAIAHLNDLLPIRCYFHSTYSPASSLHDHAGVSRLYLSEVNAGRLDAIRDRIAHWRDAGLIGANEETLLLADLIGAVNRVANIAGTYGCFMSSWQPNALRSLVMTARTLRSRQVAWTATMGDATTLQVEQNDLMYLDPPYTKRQYASYYHILESIVRNDRPAVQGVSGLRPWREQASVFCYKRKALSALVDAITGCRAGRVVLSYSSEGHVDLDDLLSILELTGDVTCTDIDGIGRYRPNRAASSRGDTVTEYVITYRGYPPSNRSAHRHVAQRELTA